MPTDMSQASLVADLKASLHDSGKVFLAADDGDFKRFLAQALPDLSVKRPVTRSGAIALEAGVDRYPLALADFSSYKTHSWADMTRAPRMWEPGYPGAVPRVRAQFDGEAWALVFDPAPSAAQLAVFGNLFRFWYFARHVIGEASAETTVNPLDRGLLLLRAQVEAMREAAIRNATKPVNLRDGMSGTPRNATPAALAEQLLAMFREAR